RGVVEQLRAAARPILRGVGEVAGLGQCPAAVHDPARAVAPVAAGRAAASVPGRRARPSSARDGAARAVPWTGLPGGTLLDTAPAAGGGGRQHAAGRPDVMGRSLERAAVGGLATPARLRRRP